MQNLFLRDNNKTFLNTLIYIISQLKLYEYAASYITPLSALLDALRVSVKSLGNIDAKIDAAHSNVLRYDSLLDRAVIKLSYSVLAQVAGDRNHSLYKFLFSISPSTMIKDVASKKQQDFIEQLITHLKNKEEYAMFGANLAELTDINAKLNDAIANEQALTKLESEENAKLKSIKKDAADLYRKTYYQLILEYPYDKKDEIEALFSKQ